MRATIWGCRGSLASPGPDTVRFGGQTSCVALGPVDDGELVVLDAGTGIRSLGLELRERHPRRIDLLITHLHTDHIEGLRFFDPLWDPSVRVTVWGPPSPLRSLRDRIAPFFAPPFFPVHLTDIPSRPEFRDAPSEPWPIGPFRVTASLIKHPGPTVGYRVELDGRVLAYLPDHEPALGTDLVGSRTEWISGFAIARRADLLLHDGQYTEREYEARVGWGHSSTDDAVAFARRVGAGRLVLFHHDPMHGDEALDGILAHARADGDGRPREILLARDGMVLDVS